MNARNTREEGGRTLLHYKKSLRENELLLNAGADPNIRDNKGKTPLHYANSPEIAALLIRAGADLNAKDNEGRTPVQTNRYVHQAAISMQKASSAQDSSKKKKTSFCTYTAGYSKIRAVKCDRRKLCLAEVSCTFKIGNPPNIIEITEPYQAVCSTLPNDQCPSADRCVSDKSVVKVEEERSFFKDLFSLLPFQSFKGGY